MLAEIYKRSWAKLNFRKKSRKSNKNTSYQVF